MDPVNENSSTDVARFCPACGSADVVTSTLAGGDAACNVCSWKGQVEDLHAFRFSHDLGTPEEVFRLFFLDIRKLLSRQFATEIGRLLIKWGFMDAPTAKNAALVQAHLARYVGSIGRAIAESVVQTRAEIEKERHCERSAD
jgi:hypothetical protein